MTPSPSTAASSSSAAEPLGAVQSSIELVGRSGQTVVASVRAFGSGPTFCFLHGLVGLNEHWEDSAQTISDEARCVLFQLPLLRLKGADCSIYGATELTARFLRQQFDGPVVLVGNSFGGHVATRVALDHPELVAGLVLAGSSGLIERTTVKEIQLRPSRDWLAERLAELFHDPVHIREADLDRAHAELSERSGARAMIKLSRSARKDHLGARLGEIRCPTLLVWGRQDVVTPPEAAMNFAESIPTARLVWFDHCGHAPMMEMPDRFAEELRSFAREVSGHAAHGSSPQRGSR
ncbi:MAG: alpha/beta fold hydrolase [Phycisphaerales bacterium]